MVENLKTVMPGLYRSGTITPVDLSMLTRNPYNIRKIISLDRDVGMQIAPYMKKYNIEHIFLPIIPGGDIRGPANTIGTNARQLLSSNDGSVLVHCARGKDRTGFAIAMYNVVINGRACDVAIQEQEKLGYGSGISEQAEKTFNTEICRRCNVGHKHYCEVADKAKDNIDNIDNIVAVGASLDIRDLLDNELTLSPGLGGTSNPDIPGHNSPESLTQLTYNSQQSSASFADPSNDSSAGTSHVLGDEYSDQVLSADDGCECKMKDRKQILKKILLLKLLLEKENEDKNDLPQVGMRSNYNGIPDSSLNPPSGADGSTPGSNMSAGPVSGSGSQI